MGAPVNLWKPEFMLDIDIIDEQHKGFFDLCLNAATLCEAARSKPVQLPDVVHLVYGMRTYAFKHFYTEETLLLKYGYPKFYGHICLHDIFLRTLQEVVAELHMHLTKADTAGQEAFLACANRINEYLVNWWGEHIMNADQEYAKFIREHKGRKG